MPIKFCSDCHSILSPNTLSGEIVFNCNLCGKPTKSDPTDTLRMEVHFEAHESLDKYITLIENSPYDIAGQKINKPCPKCNMPFMTLIYVGKDYKVLHTCVCGWRE